MHAVSFTVAGQPVPQPRARITTRCGHGHAYTPASHPIHAYRAAIAKAAREAGATPTLAEPITLIVDLVWVRPKSHYRKRVRQDDPLHPIREDAPKIPRADCSNCLKGIEDALNGVAWVDDKQVGRLVVEKSYGTEARTTVRVS